ncbi:MAG TPA: transposase [Chthoniobacterales bacterium]
MKSRRKCLGHDGVPHTFRWSAVFFITICGAGRHRNVLCTEQVGERILEAARHYERINRWHVGLLVLMPDHLHGIFSFPYDQGMTSTVQQWKHYLARTYGLHFQRDFFDHRIRPGENYKAKVQYILNNPVRAGLVPNWQDWPYLIHRTACNGAGRVVQER